jgi:lipoate-protein ligase A
MFLLDLTLPTPAENLALDQALLDAGEGGHLAGETLRLWESPQPIVVLGRSSRVADEVNVAACRAREIPILRRSSGGTAIVAGPGCLMYALVLSYQRRPELRPIDAAHCFVLSAIAAALRPLVGAIEHRGTSDLAIGERKCSGNSMRCAREHFLYHGTVLYDFPLELIAECLTMPSRQPEYRQGRSHREFVTNIPLTAANLRGALQNVFGATIPMTSWPHALTETLALEKYATAEWTNRH